MIFPTLNLADLKYIQKEDTFKNNNVFKGVRLDVYVEDVLGRMFDIEMQLTDQKNLGNRIAYYQSFLTQQALFSGQDYNDKLNTYVIFICNFDYGGSKLPLYTTELRLKQNQTLLETGEYNTILNAQATDFSDVSPGLAAFLKYVATGVPTSDFTEKIDEYVANLKNNTEKGYKYMFHELELKEARTEGKESLIATMITNMISEGSTKADTCSTISKLTAVPIADVERIYDKTLEN